MDINWAKDDTPNINDDKVFIIASVETFKRQKCKCGKDEVFVLAKDEIKDNITREIFDKTLNSLIDSGSVKCSLIWNRTCLSLRKHNVIKNSSLQRNVNNFKEDLMKDFDKFENKLFIEVKSFKDKSLDSFENVVHSLTDDSKISVAHVLEEVYFLLE